MRTPTRREFVAAPLGLAAARLGGAAAEPDDEVAFFLVGDTHYLADKQQPDRLDPTSAATNRRLVDVLNTLPGTAIPDAAGGGRVAAPRGLIHAGDVIDSGDKNGGPHAKMQQTEWDGFAADYGLTGKDGRLKFPVYEVHGNHDGPRGEGLAVEQIAKRNKTRPGVAAASENGLHYSWDWGGVHFVNLGIVVGAVAAVKRKRRYEPLDSLGFLAADLDRRVGKSGRPVVVTHHVDMARYSTAPNPDGPPGSAEWDPADVKGYHDALRGYNVVAILYGHTHVRDVYRWDGTPNKKAEQGHPAFNVDNSAHFASRLQAAFYFHLRGGEMGVREFATTDAWETFSWTPQKWTRTYTPAAK